MFLNYSGHDPTSVYNMEPIQKGPLFPPVHLCATGYYFLYWPGYLQEPLYLPFKYVSS